MGLAITPRVGGRTGQFAFAFLQFPRPALARRHRRGGGVISRRARQYRPEHHAPRRQPDPSRWSLSALKSSSVCLAGEKRRPPDRAGRASDEDLCCPERKSSSGSHGAISVAGRPIIVRERQKRGQSYGQSGHCFRSRFPNDFAPTSVGALRRPIPVPAPL